MHTLFDNAGRTLVEGVTWWDGKGITPATVRAEVTKLAEENPGTVRNCVYNRGGVPECIVGQAVFNLTGKVVSDETHSGSITWRPEWISAFGFKNLTEAMENGDFTFISKVQQAQDQGRTWGDALRFAQQGV